MKNILPLLPCLLFCLYPAEAREAKVLQAGVKPESVCRGFGGKLYVTVIGGDEPGDGAIHRIEGDAVSAFCRGLNDPKGIAFAGGCLVVADGDIVWKVNESGAATKLAEAKDFPRPVEFLNDVAAGPDGGSVYVTDMSKPDWMFDPDGERKLWPVDSASAKPPMTGCVYRVTLEGKVSLAVPPGNEAMPGPNGVAVETGETGERLAMGDFFTGNIVSHHAGKFEVLATGMRGADGVALDGDTIYVSSWTEGKIWKLDRKTGQRTVLSDRFTTAADFFFDRENQQLVVPDMLEGTVTFLPLD
jgi:sugar lactone lactonase YvrE